MITFFSILIGSISGLALSWAAKDGIAAVVSAGVCIVGLLWGVYLGGACATG